MGLLAQIQDRGVEEMEYMEGNNLGKHPQTPVTSRSGSPVNTCAGKQVPMGVVEGTEQPPTSSIDFGLAGSSQTSEDKMEAITLPTAASISTPTQPALASAAPTISTIGLTAHAAAISPSNTTPTSGKQKKVDVHALFQGRGVPLGTTTDTVLVSPEAPTQPPATTPPIPPQWRPRGYYYLPLDSHYNPYAYWGTHPIYQHPHAPPAYPSRIPPPLPRSSNLRPSLAPATPGTELFDTLSVQATISLREPSNEPSPPSVDSCSCSRKHTEKKE
ncbi:unnamed protein product [Rhizoctonia solani]|uniref:Uncharacterized protein n=1 Tax=Rhizoctonia solani TaxID=456999 RepID=A0A8H3H2L4_9AGAM|nr:unnamed protein product [Rhizoctonia solani]